MAANDSKAKALTDDRVGIRGATQKKVNCSEWFPVFKGYGDKPKNLIALFKHEYNASSFCEITADRKRIEELVKQVEEAAEIVTNQAAIFKESKAIQAATIERLEGENKEMRITIFSVNYQNKLHPNDWPAPLRNKVDKILGIAAHQALDTKEEQ